MILSLILPEVKPAFNASFAAPAVADDHRPTYSFGFEPTVEEETEAVEVLNNDDFGASRRSSAARSGDTSGSPADVRACKAVGLL